jgi:hypothetical protein
MTERKADRDARLKAALRENLRKRKAQERGSEPAAPPLGGASAPAERCDDDVKDAVLFKGA